MANLLPNPKVQFFDSDGSFLVGGKVYTYEPGTTTPKDTYTTAAGITPNSNPVLLNSRGEATIFWDGNYKVTVTDADDNLIYTVDNINAGSVSVESYLTVSGTNTITATAASTISAYQTGQVFSFIPAGTNTAATTINIDSLGAKNVYSNGAACAGGELKIGVPVQVMYDGTQFNIVGTSVITASQMNSGAAASGTVATANGSGGVTYAATGVPTGTILDFGGTVAPTGYLGCDGTAVSRTTYATLFGVIGTTWGAGNGSTTFNLPDFQRRVAVGSGGSGTGTLGNAVGNTGGAETHTLTTPEIPAHTHAQDALTKLALVGTGADSTNNNANAIGGTTGSTGGGGAHNNMQPSAVVLKIIKT